MTVALVAALRLWGPLLLAVAAAWAFDAASRRRGLDPPAFANPARRIAGWLLLTLVFWGGIFAPLGSLDRPAKVDVAHLQDAQLFALHALLVVTLAGWYLLGFAGPGRPMSGGFSPAAQLGLRAPSIGREIGLGIGLGVGIWAVVLAALVAIGAILFATGQGDLLPKSPPPFVPWLASRPWLLRLAISLSAGLVEEAFFRGFLQPRLGIAASTACFALAHLSYGEPFLLVGVTLLSIVYGLLVRWRQSIWAAAAAHALFDGVQLLVLVPLVMKEMGGSLPVALAALGLPGIR